MIASVARRYARALLELGVESSSSDQLGTELDSVAAAVKASSELRDLLTNPAFNREQRHGALAAVSGPLGLSPTVQNLMKLLIDRRRADQIADIARQFHELADEKAGRARAQVWTASPLPPELSVSLATALSVAVKRTVTIEAHVDASLLGGAVAQVGSYLYDGSIQGRLKDLRRELKKS